MRSGRAADPTGPAVAAAALLVGAQIAGKATRDALFLSHFDVARLPAMTATAAAVSLAATLAFSRAMVHMTPARLVPSGLQASAALFAAEWALAATRPRAAAVLVYLHQAVLGALLLSGFWSMVNERFDPYSARKAMGRIGAGASLGGVLGGILAWRAASLLSVPSLLLVLAAASAVATWVLRPLRAGPVPAPGESPPAGPTPSPSAGRPALALIRERPYLRDLALLVAACGFLDAVLDYLLGATAAASLPPGAPLLAFFSLFHAATGLGALVAQALLVRPSLGVLGVAPTLSLSALFTAGAAGLVLAWPRLGTVALLRGGHAVLRNSAFRSAYELLYTPLAFEEKRATKVVIDVAFDRLGTIAGSAAVLALIALAPRTSALLVALALVAALLALALAPRFRRGYVAALATGLRVRAPADEPASLVEPTTLLTLASLHAVGPGRADGGTAEAGGDPVVSAIVELRSGEAGRVRAALACSRAEPALVPHVAPLLARDDLADAAAAYLRRAALRATGQLVDVLLDPGADPAVRRRVARILKDVPTQRAADGLLQGLADARFDVRYRCAQALRRLRGRHPELVTPRETVLEAARREAHRAGEGPRQLEHVFTLLGIVLDRVPLRIAARALAASDPNLRGTALEYLDNVLPPAVRDALWPHLGVGMRPAVSGRSLEAVRDDLLRSSTIVGPRPRP